MKIIPVFESPHFCAWDVAFGCLFCDDDERFPSWVFGFERASTENSIQTKYAFTDAGACFGFVQSGSIILSHRDQSQLYAARQQRTICNASKGYEVVMTGRRRQTNTLRSSWYEKEGIIQCHPLIDWTDDDVLTYLQYHKIPLPRIYQTDFGAKEGFDPWVGIDPSRHTKPPWQIVYEIEPQIVQQAARAKIASAQQWLDSASSHPARRVDRSRKAVRQRLQSQQGVSSRA